MADSEQDTTRTVVKTYVPAYQREEWDDHADELGMSRSEFVRSMVQAGRRGFEATQTPESDSEQLDERGPSTEQASPTDLEETVLETMTVDQYLSWEDLLRAVTDDIEQRLEETLQALQATDQIRYSGRNGGYTLEE
ncbi:MAG: DUF5805 domain-containing protein [Haloarculaceae archaeon]